MALEIRKSYKNSDRVQIAIKDSVAVGTISKTRGERDLAFKLRTQKALNDEEKFRKHMKGYS